MFIGPLKSFGTPNLSAIMNCFCRDSTFSVLLHLTALAIDTSASPAAHLLCSLHLLDGTAFVYLEAFSLRRTRNLYLIGA